MKPTKKSYDDSCSRSSEIMNTPALRKSKYYINTGSFRHHNNCGSTHPSTAASKENKLPPSFSGFTSQTLSMNPAMMGSQEQTMMNSRQKTFANLHLWLLEAYTCQLSRLRVENFDLTPAHACGPISHAWLKNVSCCRLAWHNFQKYVNSDPCQERKPCVNE